MPIGLLAVPRTRRFGIYMVLGMVLTALVVLGVAALVLYYLDQARQADVFGLSPRGVG